MNLPRPLRLYYIRAQRLRGSVDALALGAALGAAIACTPIMPLHTFATIAVAFLLRVNVVAALLAGTLVSNPLTVVPQYYLVWKIGNVFFSGQLSWERIKNILHQIEEQGFLASADILRGAGWDSIKVMLTGGLILAVPVGLGTYFLSRWFFISIRRKKREKRLLNNKK
ncbi:MAG: DUF2062 domain-containing protein [Desulfobulbaceae bacterium]|nr:DUF2062 domain-containing protein [Desulfobulbaceae bacterium]